MGFIVHYANGFGSVFSVIGAFSLTGERPLAKAARFLLDMVGLGFGAYLLAFILLILLARWVQRHGRCAGHPSQGPQHLADSRIVFTDDTCVAVNERV